MKSAWERTCGAFHALGEQGVFHEEFFHLRQVRKTGRSNIVVLVLASFLIYLQQSDRFKNVERCSTLNSSHGNLIHKLTRSAMSNTQVKAGFECRSAPSTHVPEVATVVDGV